MACSKYEVGYEDNRFEIVVSQRFHCPICFLVLKDPVMCKNEHYYCSSCMKKHLENSSFCPTCLEHLSVDTLRPASRIVNNYISELNIHCDFYPRGCPEMVQVENLKRHVASCGFSPVQCSNDGCIVLVNASDKLHHETEVCDFRKWKCHDCGQLKNEVKQLKDEMLGMKGELKVMIKNEMKGMKEEMKNEMKEIAMNAVRDAMAGRKGFEAEMKNSKQRSQATCSSDARESIFVVGGRHKQGGRSVKNKSTECFNLAGQTWTSLDSAVFEGRTCSCSFLYQGQMVVVGGNDDGGNKTNTMKCLNVAHPAATWKDFAGKLPVKCSSHKVVNHNDRLFMCGGWVQATDGGLPIRSNVVYEVQLVPPYSSKMLTRLPQPRSDHGMEMFDQKLFILGGYDGERITASVVQYDLIKSKCKEMPPLPYVVQDLASVVWRNNVLVIGGLNADRACLNTVVIYDVITGRSRMLPCMKQKRSGCTAVLTGNVVVVMGGRNEKGEDLKSVECFDLQRKIWQDLPDMLEPRAHATAVIKPNH